MRERQQGVCVCGSGVSVVHLVVMVIYRAACFLGNAAPVHDAPAQGPMGVVQAAAAAARQHKG